jgi:transcriptional regulator with XRE-family HTH domain
VIDMAFLSVIRRWALREGISIREIAQRTGLSRNTVRKYLRSGAVEPKFKVPKRTSKLDPFVDKLSLWLEAEAGKSRKQRRTVKQLHADLAVLGYEGSYGRVAAFSRAWKADRVREQQGSGRGTFVPLAFQRGEALQFDWSEAERVNDYDTAGSVFRLGYVALSWKRLVGRMVNGCVGPCWSRVELSLCVGPCGVT